MHSNKLRTLSLLKKAPYFVVVLLCLSGCDDEKNFNNGVVPHTDATYAKYKRDLATARAAAAAAAAADSVRLQTFLDSANKQK